MIANSSQIKKVLASRGIQASFGSSLVNIICHHSTRLASRQAMHTQQLVLDDIQQCCTDPAFANAQQISEAVKLN